MSMPEAPLLSPTEKVPGGAKKGAVLIRAQNGPGLTLPIWRKCQFREKPCQFPHPGR